MESQFPLTVIDWASKRLTRVCRSSLAAEAQTLAMAVDSLEWLKCLFALMIWPNQRPDNEDIMKWLGESPCITRCQSVVRRQCLQSARHEVDREAHGDRD